MSLPPGHHLRASSPAAHWWEAYPVGNGRLGAMVRGGVAEEIIDLNDDTLWSGTPAPDPGDPSHRELLPRLRSAIAADEHARADALARRMHGAWTQAYQPLGFLRLRFPRLPADHAPTAYRRLLDLSSGVARVEFEHESQIHRCEVYASHPADVIVVDLSTDAPGGVVFEIALGGALPHHLETSGVTELTMSGRAPDHVEPSYSASADPIRHGGPVETIAFKVAVRVVASGAELRASPEGLSVRGAPRVTLLLCAATSYAGFGLPLDPARPGRIVAARLDAAHQALPRLRDEHEADHRALYERCSLQLGRADASADTHDTAALRTGPASSPALAALLFHYGRYLLIACSRPGSQPANLQGIWNESPRPPWSCNYTTNINLQMNYWPAEPTGLPECHEPLLDFIRDLAVSGARIARAHYDAPGWCLHHNSDLWRTARPMKGEPMWANWYFGGVWLCAHLWEHYAFTGDTTFLRERAWPLLRGAAEFVLAWLHPRPDGRLVPTPSSSPEHRFHAPDGTLAAVCAGSAIDLALARELLTRCIETARILEADDAFSARCAAALSSLAPPAVSPRCGALQEWPEDWPPEQARHRHASHLYALHPSDAITPDTPDLFAAARRALELRGDGGTGWALAWKISFWARLRDGDHAHRIIDAFLRPYDRPGYVTNEEGGLYPNLFCAHAPFQIDGNFGFTAGVVELLLQSHSGIIDLLPALPSAWPEGSVRGLRARGGVDVCMSWRRGVLRSVTITSKLPGTHRVRLAGEIHTLHLDAGSSWAWSDHT